MLSTFNGQCNVSNIGLTYIKSGVFCMSDRSRNNGRPCTDNELINILRMENNKLDSLIHGNFDNLGNLYALYLTNNSIDSIQTNIFKPLKRLILLNLNGNKLSIIKNNMFYHLFQLKQMYIDNNIIRRIEPSAFKGLTNLKVLSLSGNMLSTFDTQILRGLNQLNELDISNNDIVLRNIDNLNNLEKLNLHRNKIDEFNFNIFNVSMIRVLNISHCEITIVKGNISQLLYLDEVDLSGNMIRKFNIKGLQYYMNTGGKLILEDNRDSIILDCNYMWLLDLNKTKHFNVKMTLPIVWSSSNNRNRDQIRLPWRCVFQYSSNYRLCRNRKTVLENIYTQS